MFTRVALLGCLIAAGVSLGLSHEQTVTVVGRVVADATNEPVRHAWVVVRATDREMIRVGVSDLNGEFRFEGLPRGSYRVGSSKRPYLAAAADVSAEPVVLRLSMGATVFGVVTEMGKPVKDVRIALSGPSLIPRSGTTDARGEYRIHGLPAGEYELSTARSVQSRTVTLAAGEAAQALPLELQEATVYSETAPTPVAGGTGIVGGRVLDVRTAEPLAGIQINLGRTGTVTTSDANGRFRFDKLRPGTFGLIAQHPEYFAVANATVTVDPTTNISDVVLRVGRHAAITGTVRDDVGDPVVGMPVMAFRRAISGLRPLAITGPAVYTNERGAYRVDGLSPGDYIVCACADRPPALDPLLMFALGLTEAATARITNDFDETVLTFPPTYSPGRTRGSDAQVVNISYGDVRIGIDISLYGAKPFTVSGQVLEGGRAPSERQNLRLFPEGDLGGALFIANPDPVAVSADGTFRLRGIPPGRYTLFASSADGARSASGTLSVQVEDRDVEGLILNVRELPAVQGRLEFSGRTSVPDSTALTKATVSLISMESFSIYQLLIAATTGSVGTGATPDANGRFTIPNVRPGIYSVSIRIPDSNWRTVERVTTPDDGVNLDGQLRVGPDGTDDLVVTVSDVPMSNLEGTAVLERYQSPGSVRVVAFPADKSVWPDAARYPARFAFVFLSATHTFRMEALPPGEYFVALVGTGFELSMEEMERWSQTAQRVRLRGGETLKLELKR